MNRENRFRNKNNLYRLKNADAAELYLQDREHKTQKIKRIILAFVFLPLRAVLTSFYVLFLYSFILASEEVAAFGLSLGNFAVEDVVIQNNVIVSRESIVEALKINASANILAFDLEDLRSRIERIRNIKSAEIKRVLPAKLFISVKERIPFFRIGEGQALIDVEGRAVNIDNGITFFRNLPVLKGVKINASSGDIMASDMERYINSVRLASEFDGRFKNENIQFDVLELFDDWAEFHIKSGPLVRAPLNAETVIFERLAIVLNDLKRKGNIPSFIDLQFKDVIVKL